jgi:hypothetical protein
MVSLYKFWCVGHPFSASANGFRKDGTADHFRFFGFVLSSAIVRRTTRLTVRLESYDTARSAFKDASNLYTSPAVMNSAVTSPEPSVYMQYLLQATLGIICLSCLSYTSTSPTL